MPMGVLNKRSISIHGHKTGIFVEPTFWLGLKEIAASKRMTISGLVEMIDRNRTDGNLSAVIRIFVLEHYRNLAENDCARHNCVRQRSQNG
jgi:predicted DNA-binding ribbon-helix-helix protein